ncbi:MAG: uracil-DNA glycosylase [Deltaproteobacteria bacterium]|nr:MAG: uracil-DNA glycosylase [Deltaproteobacteria bacterium]
MGAEDEPREELLGLVRSLTERVRLDGELRKPLCYLSPGKAGVEMPAAAAPQPVAGETEPAVKRSGVEISALDPVLAELGDCRRCPLGALRHRLVFGEGNPGAELVFVGEAPGADEDAQGRPFVGRAGQLLTKIIAAMGLKREDVYICNILKCRPPGNRNPLPDEIAACEPFLIRQIEAIRPRVICALGGFAAQTLLKSDALISALRGRFHQYQGIPLMPTYHPAYLLRNPGAKKQVWEDVQAIMKLLREGS